MSNEANATEDAMRQSTPDQLRHEVEVEITRRENGNTTPPFGGFRNQAVEHVAYRHGMNPYTLDHIIRGIG